MRRERLRQLDNRPSVRNLVKPVDAVGNAKTLVNTGDFSLKKLALLYAPPAILKKERRRKATHTHVAKVLLNRSFSPIAQVLPYLDFTSKSFDA
jgi:hypothetical protein